jgi:signal transduction histidine kinase
MPKDPLTDLAALIEAAVDTVSAAAGARNIRIRVHAEDVPVVEADPTRVQQALWNLLSNAVKFSPPGGQVDVVARRRAAHAEILVRDSGIGIAPAFLPHVFDRFRQADASTTRAHGGLGLGLAIVRHVAELHGGSVHAESAGEGAGTTFTLLLPIRSGGSADAGNHRVTVEKSDAPFSA